MSKWKKLSGVDLEDLRSTRKALHQAVQLVGAVPRTMLPHDPTDGTASLQWNKTSKGLQSIPIVNSSRLEVCAGLSFNTFSLYLSTRDIEITSIKMEGKSTMEGLAWLKKELERLSLKPDKLSLKLPYEIANYDYSVPLAANKLAQKEYARLYRNTHNELTQLVRRWENAFDIRCWPHHFDLATLIPIETDDDDEILKSIGIGLSPGDEMVQEPYVYVNVWPELDEKSLTKHTLPKGKWNVNGWSGAILTYSELLEETDQQETFSNFTNFTIKCILSELKIASR